MAAGHIDAEDMKGQDVQDKEMGAGETEVPSLANMRKYSMEKASAVQHTGRGITKVISLDVHDDDDSD